MSAPSPRSVGRLYERIAAEIREALATGRYGIGDRLPSERDLARQFGVSRPTVREAIIALEVDGLVEVRTSSGVYVAALDPKGGERAEADVGPLELLEAQRIFEGEICGLAAQRIDVERIARLRALVTDMESDEAFRAEAAEREFHLEIARATRNGAMVRIVSMLWDARARSRTYKRLAEKARAAGAAPGVADHHRIIDALAAGKASDARDAMRDHLGRVIEVLLGATEVEAIGRAAAGPGAKAWS